MDDEAEDLARLILRGGDYKNNKEARGKERSKYRVTIISADGEALYDTERAHSRVNYNTKPEVMRAVLTGRLEFASRLHDGHYRYFVARTFRHPYRPSAFITVRLTFNRSSYHASDKK